MHLKKVLYSDQFIRCLSLFIYRKSSVLKFSLITASGNLRLFAVRRKGWWCTVPENYTFKLNYWLKQLGWFLKFFMYEQMYSDRTNNLDEGSRSRWWTICHSAIMTPLKWMPSLVHLTSSRYWNRRAPINEFRPFNNFREGDAATCKQRINIIGGYWFDWH